jgi:hypothetical protein
MSRLFSRRPDPFWEDGRGARRARIRRRILRAEVAIIAIILVALVVTRLPAIDTEYLLSGEGKPIMAGALMALLGSSVLVALARMRKTNVS